VIVLGIDPGFASLGWALVELDKTSEELLALGLISTAKANKKLNMLATDDNVRRMREIHAGLEWINERAERYTDGINAIAIESQSWPRNASATAKVGMAWGIVTAFACAHDIAIVQATPMQIKEHVTGAKTATKDAVRKAVGAMPGMESLEEHLGKIRAKTKHEHPVDAVAAVLTCRAAPAIQVGRSI
jgi:crossover junction endodeoxyribonuclease RuvC